MNRRFQAKRVIFIFFKLLHQLQPNSHNDKDNQVAFVGGPNVPQTNPRWRMAAILEN